MRREKKPVKINGIEFDALISSENTLEATVPEYAVEDGFSVSDNIVLGSETLSLVLFLTDTPVTWEGRSGHGEGHTESAIQKLRDLYYSKELCTINTTEKTYTDMAIEHLTISKSLETGYAREIPISFRQIRKTTVETTTVPEEYGKSGATEEPAGTASTSAGSSGGSGGSGGSSGSGSSSSGLRGQEAEDYIMSVSRKLHKLANEVKTEEKKKEVAPFGESKTHVGIGGMVFGGKTGKSFANTISYSGTSGRSHSGSGAAEKKAAGTGNAALSGVSAWIKNRKKQAG